MKKIILTTLALAIASLLFVPLVTAQDARTPEQICTEAGSAPEPTSRSFTQAEKVLQPGVDYRAIFCTDAGPIYIDLLEDYASLTVNNFVFLSEQGFYNNTTFHRVIQDFMAQGGDPTATGTGGPGYQFEDEFAQFLVFDTPGKLAMANAGANTNGSQFFITTAPTEHLNYKHTIFGEVLEGQENVGKIRLRDPETDSEPGTQLNTVVIITDPTTVTTTYTDDTASATQEEIVTAFDAVNSIITPEVQDILENTKEVQTTEQAAEAGPEGMADFLESHNHEFRVSSFVNNKACDTTQVAFLSMRFTVDAFASRADATAALADDFMATIPEANGYTGSSSANLLYPLFTKSTNVCDLEATQALTYWQHGRYVVTAEITIPTDEQNVSMLDLILLRFVGQRVFEPLLYEAVFKGELR